MASNNTMDKAHIAASSFYLFVVIFIGIPMWFYTCSTVRYSLPSLDQLEASLYSSNARIHLDVSVVNLHDESFNVPLSEHLRNSLPKQLDTKFLNISYQIEWRVRRPVETEINIFSDFESQPNSDIVGLETKLTNLHKTSNRFRLFVYITNEKFYLKYGCKSKHNFNIAYERFAFLCPDYLLVNDGNYESVQDIIVDIISTTHVNSIKPVTHNLLSSKVDLLVSFIPENYNEQNSLIDKTNLLHNVFQKNVKRKFPELTEIFNINLITQNLIDFEIKTVSKINATRGFIDSREIDNVFDRFESRISKHSKEVHNLILYLPSVNSNSIVFKHDSKLKLTDEMSIVIGPDSNSMLIANDEKTLILGFRTLIRHLLGLRSVSLCDKCLVRRNVFLNRWELDAIVGILTIRKLQATLQSLSSMNAHVANIRILKEVTIKANEAVNHAMDALRLLEIKDTLGAYRSAHRAYDMSNSAFFDPTLLESLYFPDNLRYAIYLPLFLPLGFPMLMSVVQLVKMLMLKKKSPKVK